MRKCIVQQEAATHDDNIEKVNAYAAWNNNSEVVRQSSSGGVFSALAAHIFSLGGCVFGVVWQDKETVSFRKAEDMETLAAMRGSKYTPAIPGNVYRDVRNELKAGRHVLFTGTPCQVQALHSFLGKEYECLVTMDIVCHGMPSRLVLQRYIRDIEAKEGKEIERINFRYKQAEWDTYHVCHLYRDGSSDNGIASQNDYMRVFLSDTTLNYSCYNCPFAHLPRPGDLSVGDYWGVREHHPEWPITDGISCVIANNEKSERIFQDLGAKLHMEKEDFQRIYDGQRSSFLKPDAVEHPNRPYVMTCLKNENKQMSHVLHQAFDYSFVKNWRFKNDSYIFRFIRFLRRLLS